MQIIFEFVGGPLDGKTVVGRADQQDEADRYYALTHHGKIGQRFRVASALAIDALAAATPPGDRPFHFQQHSYQVSDRIEGDDEILLRARYIEDERPGPADAPVRDHLEPALPQARSDAEMIERIIRQTSRSLADSYSHYWPAKIDRANDGLGGNLTMHLAHVLLGKDFSTFGAVPHPADDAGLIDLVGIAPGQDCFVACQLPALDNDTQLAVVADGIERLATYWLDASMTNAASREILTRVAAYCERGYGIVAGMHWMPAEVETTLLLAYWRSPDAKAGPIHALHDKLAALGAVCMEPLGVRSFGQQGTWYLLSLYFRIPH